MEPLPVRFTKPPLSYEQQADLMLQRGLEADRALLVERLSAVNYFRLSGYLHPFRQADGSYVEGTSLDTVWRRYTFDRRLRLLTLDAIERAEVAIRTRVVYEHAHRFGPFGYTLPANLPNLNVDQHGKLLAQIYNEMNRSHEAFVRHFRNKHGDEHAYLPLWMAAEIIPFGAAFTLYRGVPDDIKKAVSWSFGQPNEVFESWLLSLNTVRNVCAHHARLWNRTLGLAPKVPRINKHPEWHVPTPFAPDKCYAVLVLLKYLLNHAAPQSCWHSRLKALLDEYPEIPRADMGFPGDWEKNTIWTGQRLQTGSADSLSQPPPSKT